VSWYRKSAEAGNDTGMGYLGFMYENGYGVEKDPAQAVSWYRKGAAAGDNFSINRLKALGEDMPSSNPQH
jgi:TPR repeat protein